jgi:hypothetical protein
LNPVHNQRILLHDQAAGSRSFSRLTTRHHGTGLLGSSFHDHRVQTSSPPISLVKRRPVSRQPSQGIVISKDTGPTWARQQLSHDLPFLDLDSNEQGRRAAIAITAPPAMTIRRATTPSASIMNVSPGTATQVPSMPPLSICPIIRATITARMPLVASTITIKTIAIRTQSTPPDRHGLRTDQTNRDEISKHRLP